MQSAAPRRKLSANVAALCAIVWVAVLAFGFAGMWRYKMTAGEMSQSPARWPEGTHLLRSADRATLVMFAHPRCSCTRASMIELARLAYERHGELETLVVFLSPAGSPPGFVESDLWHSAAAIPGARVARDEGGVEAALFGAGTSGAALLYAKDGTLLFRGGITPARAHQGDSLGRERILALLDGHPVDRRDAPVFGCGLTDLDAAPLARANLPPLRGNP
jgi:hypothetical protein